MEADDEELVGKPARDELLNSIVDCLDDEGATGAVDTNVDDIPFEERFIVYNHVLSTCRHILSALYAQHTEEDPGYKISVICLAIRSMCPGGVTYLKEGRNRGAGRGGLWLCRLETVATSRKLRGRKLRCRRRDFCYQRLRSGFIDIMIMSRRRGLG